MAERPELQQYHVPETLDECAALARQLSETITDIDVQLGMLKTGGGPHREAGWHAKALAKKGHAQKHLTRVRDRLHALRKQRHLMTQEAQSKKQSLETQRLEETRAATKRAKRRARALYEWLQREFPERCDEISHIWRENGDDDGV